MKVPSVSKSKKEEVLDYFRSKGHEWLVNQLYNARKENSELRSTKERLWSDKHTIENCYHTAIEANKNLAKVLEARGITPRVLEITFYTNECEARDDAYEADKEDEFDCWYMECADCPKYYTTKHLKQFAFYTYAMDENSLNGILSTFEDVRIYHIVKVRDLTSDEVIYEVED